MKTFFNLLALAAAGMFYVSQTEAQAQVAGGAMGGGAMGGGAMAGSMAMGGAGGGMANAAMGGMANGLMGGSMTRGMASGNMMGGNMSALTAGNPSSAGWAGTNMAFNPRAGIGGAMAGAGQSMLQGMAGATLGGNNIASPGGNNMAFSQGSNLGAMRSMQGNLGAGNSLLGGTFGNNLQRHGPAAGRFSSWGGAPPGSFNRGRGGVGGYGPVMPGYTGSPMFGRTSRQQTLYGAYGSGGGF